MVIDRIARIAQRAFGLSVKAVTSKRRENGSSSGSMKEKLGGDLSQRNVTVSSQSLRRDQKPDAANMEKVLKKHLF